jgi:hypothetical protein
MVFSKVGPNQSIEWGQIRALNKSGVFKFGQTLPLLHAINSSYTEPNSQQEASCCDLPQLAGRRHYGPS